MEAHADFDRIVSRRCDFLLWRDPYSRTASAFLDKCRRAARSNGAKVQDSQRLLLQAFGLGTVTELQQVSFEQFVDVLPAIYMEDAHFRPQLYRLRPGQVGSVIDIAADLDVLGRRLGVDFAPRFNHAAHDGEVTRFTARMRAVIDELYADDFRAPRYRPGYPARRWLRLSW